MRISDWSSDVCSSDLVRQQLAHRHRLDDRLLGRRIRQQLRPRADEARDWRAVPVDVDDRLDDRGPGAGQPDFLPTGLLWTCRMAARAVGAGRAFARSEEHTSELQSLMRISYAVFCLKQKTTPLLYKHSQTIYQ